MNSLDMHIAGKVAQSLFLVSGTDIFALGHYPNNPIFPGVLIAENLCKTAQALAESVIGKPARVSGIKRIQYLDAVLPGDAVELVASVKRCDENHAEITAAARVGEKQKTRATILCAANAADERSESDQRGSDPSRSLRGERAIEHSKLADLLPHRYPFLFVDRINDYEPEKWIRGVKLVNRRSPLFLDGMPASYPQGFVIESIGQAGIALFFLSRQDAKPLDIVLGSITDVSFEADIPFDVPLTLEARIDRLLPNGVLFSGEARIGNKTVTRVGSLVAMIDPR